MESVLGRLDGLMEGLEGNGGYRAIITGAEGWEDLAALAALIFMANSSLLTTTFPNKCPHLFGETTINLYEFSGKGKYTLILDM